MRKLWKDHKGKAIISSLLVLLPMLIGGVLWNKLPGSMIIHWGGDGTADGTGSKALAVFGLPLFLLATHWLCLLVTAIDNRDREQSSKAMGLLFWIMPLLSLLVAALVYGTALGLELSASRLAPAIMAVVFIVMGNYLPKITQNRTFGIKLTWTLANKENWNRTHRLGGKLWVTGGFVLLLSLLLPLSWLVAVMLADILLMVAIPTVYSYYLSRQQKAAGTYTADRPAAKKSTKIFRIVMLVITAVAIGVLLFTGDVTVTLEETAFTVNSTYAAAITVDYAAIDRIELRPEGVPGVRSNGFGSPRLSLGTFDNKEFGHYTRYTYAGAKPCIVLQDGEHTLVISGKDAAATEALYAALTEKITVEE